VLAKVPGNGSIGQRGLIVLRTDSTGKSQHPALMHLFLEKQIPHAPLWLHEAMAGYASSMVVMAGNGGQTACFGRPIGGRDSLIPLKDLFTMDWDHFAEGPRSWYHRTAYLLMDFVLHGDDGKYRDRASVIFQQAAEGKPGADIFRSVFPELTLDALNAKISDHHRDLQYIAGTQVRGRCPLAFEIPPDKIADPGQRQVTPVPRDDMSALVEAIKRLPQRDDGYPEWYPPDVIARVDGAK
jgi:hypothetical protein